jgi:hypothetical protein
MNKNHVEIRSLAAVVLMWTATSVTAGPVIYASADPATSKGTELYVIDPIAATIALVRGIGIGAGGAGTYGGLYSGGYAQTSSGAAGDTSGVGAGDFSHFAPGSLGGSPLGDPARLDTNAAKDSITAEELMAPITGSIDIVPSRTSITSSEGLQPPVFNGSGRRLAATPSPQSNPRAGCTGDCGDLTDNTAAGRSVPPGCAGNCGDLTDAAPSGSSILSACGGNCGAELLSTPQGALQISAVPEPGVLALLGIGFAAIGIRRRRKPR